MKFICLVHLGPGVVSSLGQDEKRALDASSLAYDEELMRRGHFVAAEALLPAKSAALVKVREGKTVTNDGPFAEASEQIGGFVLIDAPDRDAAIRIAAGIPLAKLGTIEVRGIYEWT